MTLTNHNSSVKNSQISCRWRERPESSYLILTLITALFLAISLIFIVVILLSVTLISVMLLRIWAYLRESFGKNLNVKIWDG